MVDTGIGHHKTEMVLHDQQPRAMAYYPFRLAENHLDKARILVDFGSQSSRPFRGRDSRYVDVAALGFGNDLLRHNQDVAVFRDQPVCSERLRR